MVLKMMRHKTKKAWLVLQDGAVYAGRGFGAETLASGELVFNTSITGYQEILTDPSYQNQIVTMTYPHIGNCGVNSDDAESRKIFASGLVVKECARRVSNYRAEKSLDQALCDAGVPGIDDIDTRALVRHIRESGAMPALLAVGDWDVAELKRKILDVPPMHGQNLARVVSCASPYEFGEGLKDFIATQPLSRGIHPTTQKKFRVVAYDYGIKTNILRLLVEQGCDVTVVPYDYPAKNILSDQNVDGVFLSNGPGDPAACTEAIETVRQLLGKKPIFGICLGHQILSLALGAKTFKLKFGHRGGNQPVQNLQTGRVEITAQNHGFAVSDDSLPDDLCVTHINLNDKTIEGVAHKNWPVFSVQYHPESSPGPHDSRYLFQKFTQMMSERR